MGHTPTRTPPASRCSAAPQQSVPGDIRSPRFAEIGLLSNKRDKHQPVTAGPTNTSDNQMAKGKCRNVVNRNQENMAPSEPNSPTRYPNTPGKQGLDLKSQVRRLMEGFIEDFKKDINNSLKKNTGEYK